MTIDNGAASDETRAVVNGAASVSAVPASVPSAWHPDNWPHHLDTDLREILGTMCFQLIRLSRLYRAAGIDVPKRAEDEQAFFLHRYLGHWFAHGSDWATSMDAEIASVHKTAQAIEAAKADETGTGSAVGESAVGTADASENTPLSSMGGSYAF